MFKQVDPAGITTIFIDGVYEEDRNSGGTITNTRIYYPAGGAMRVNGVLSYILKDNLGSAMVTVDANGNVTGQQRYYPFGGVRSIDSTGVSTDRTYTGQRSNSYIKLLDYKSRWYDPDLGRFVSPDSIVPDLRNPQALNRYSYVFNQPINLNDPSGNDPWWDDPDFYYADLRTYVAASIAVQNSSPLLRPASIIRTLGYRYTGIGPAKVTDAQMETPLGNAIKDSEGNNRGYGLGMRDEPCSSSGCQIDQNNPDVANVAMGRRIQLVLAKCTGCNETDRFIAAALAENGPGFTQKNMTDVMDKYATHTDNGVNIDWESYLKNVPGGNPSNRELIGAFMQNVAFLKHQRWVVPNVDWDRIKKLALAY